MKGKIVLIPFPFTDLTATKLRPALVLYEGDRDIVLAFISSKTRVGAESTEVLVTISHAGFPKSGLKVDSVIRLDKVATISNTDKGRQHIHNPHSIANRSHSESVSIFSCFAEHYRIFLNAKPAVFYRIRGVTLRQDKR